MIRLEHYDDKKEKYQSHEVNIIDDDFYDVEHDVCSHNPFEITGYGETKEKAFEDFKYKFYYVMDELKAFEQMLKSDDINMNEKLL